MQTIEDNQESINSESFCYWLQGALEIMNPETLDKKQLQIVKDHLALVFKKITPDYTVTTTDTVTIPGYVAPSTFDHGSLCSCPRCNPPSLSTAIIC